MVCGFAYFVKNARILEKIFVQKIQSNLFIEGFMLNMLVKK